MSLESPVSSPTSTSQVPPYPVLQNKLPDPLSSPPVLQNKLLESSAFTPTYRFPPCLLALAPAPDTLQPCALEGTHSASDSVELSLPRQMTTNDCKRLHTQRARTFTTTSHSHRAGPGPTQAGMGDCWCCVTPLRG